MLFVSQCSSLHETAVSMPDDCVEIFAVAQNEGDFHIRTAIFDARKNL
jgi:hypothetical protein